jgi:hypothetical protein
LWVLNGLIIAKLLLNVAPSAGSASGCVIQTWNDYQIADRDSGTWKFTNPLAHTTWSFEQNQRFGGRFKPLVKLCSSGGGASIQVASGKSQRHMISLTVGRPLLPHGGALGKSVRCDDRCVKCGVPLDAACFPLAKPPHTYRVRGARPCVSRENSSWVLAFVNARPPPAARCATGWNSAVRAASS